MAKIKVLVVAETASIHAARWINQLKDTGWDIHVFQGVVTGYDVCPDFRCGTLYLPCVVPVPSGVTCKRTLPTNYPIHWASSRIGSLRRLLQKGHVLYLARLIQRLKPDVIHSLGLNVNWNNMCLPVLHARRLLGGKFRAPWVYSSWGADLDSYAQQSPKNRAEVETVLRACDYHVAECARDARLAREMGFRGEFAGYLPAFGGVAWEELRALRQAGPTSARKIIFLKGRDDPRVGRAMTAMKAFALCQDVLSDYRIVIGTATAEVASEAAVLSATTNLKIQVLPYLPYASLLRIIGASRLLLALTINDGLPSTLVEAMALGAFPMHSDLDSIREWIRDGKNGDLVPAEDPHAVSIALRRALTDDRVVDQAAEINAQIIQEQLADTVVRPKVIEMYETVVRQGPVHR
jgi:glycosyltransferase involved in cell wall biosynthesis